MLPARRKAVALAAQRWAAVRYQSAGTARSGEIHPSKQQSDPDLSLGNQGSSSNQVQPQQDQNNSSTYNSASAKLFADAEAEESFTKSSSSSRDHLRLTQGPIWDGDESTPDAVLRMLVDAHKPLRTGTGVKYNSADEKIKGWMKNLKLEPKDGTAVPLPRGPPSTVTPGLIASPSVPSLDTGGEDATDKVSPHRTTIPPHLHRPWHATYTGDKTLSAEADGETPKIKYGTFIRKKADGDSLTNLLELQLPPGADGKTRAKVKQARKTGKLVQRVESAREGALDYKVGLNGSSNGNVIVEEGDEEEEFMGNRQIRGSSVLGAQKGGASGLRAWAGLVEDRIQRARDAGFFKVTKGHGKPIPKDPESHNPYMETGERLMNRIIKQQGALPPWIELQNTLDSTHNAFRRTLLQTYALHVTRMVMATNTLNPLPLLHTIPTRDEAWEARELKFHEENVKQINDLIRKMNTLAPSVVRRPVTSREMELQKIRGETLRMEVWTELQRRSEEARLTQSNRPINYNSPYFMESEGLKKLKTVARRSLWTLAHPVKAVIGKANVGGVMDGRSSDSNHDGGSDSAGAYPQSSPGGLIFVVGLGAGVIYLLRKPTKNDSAPIEDFIPLHPPRKTTPSNPSHIVATSPDEPRMGPIRIIQVYILEPIFTMLRFFHLAILFGPVILTAPMLLVGKPERRRRRGKPVAEDEDNWGAVWWYTFLVKQMERAGPSFIKLGQWAASRADLFPAALCDRMSKLHSNNKPHSIQHTRRVIEKAFGLRFSDIFEEFGEEPIGCGAIAQVYKAKLRPEVINGTELGKAKHLHESNGNGGNGNDDLHVSPFVAIKVLHPRVAKTIRRDITIMSVFANIINAFPGMQWISLPEEVQVFGGMMNSQLDLRVEASNLDKFDKNFRKRGPRVTFPRPIKLGKNGDGLEREESKEVLMEEFEDALPLKYFLTNGGGPYDDKIANIGLDAFLEMLLLDNWTHGDLHPGNIMVRFYKPHTKDYFEPILAKFRTADTSTQEHTIPLESISATQLVHSLSSLAHDPEKWHERLEELDSKGYEPQLIFIDAGLVTSLDANNRRNFLDLFQAVAEFDGYKAGKLMIERCRTPELAIDEETFALKVQHLVLSVKSKTFSLAKIKISDILTDVLTAVRQHHVKMEGDFVNTVISILLLEGIGRQLDPNMDLFKSALPILRQIGRQMGTREAISAVPKGNIWAMVKLWVWVEAREIAGQASTVDEWITYDRFMPAV